MAKPLDLNKSYTFRKIFELNIEVDELVAEFGYSLTRKRLHLPQYSGEDFNSYRVIEDLEPLMRILVKALLN